jgi:hypothetical protein
MAYGIKTGGRPKGGLNKKTIAKRQALEEAQRQIAAVDGSGMFDGDMYALLTTVAKCEKFPIELRVDCAKATIGYERPRLEATTITDNRDYIVHMPAPVQSLEDWRKTADIEPSRGGAWDKKLLELKRLAKADGGAN